MTKLSTLVDEIVNPRGSMMGVSLEAPFLLSAVCGEAAGVVSNAPRGDLGSRVMVWSLLIH
jgi:hypothetical protein